VGRFVAEKIKTQCGYYDKAIRPFESYFESQGLEPPQSPAICHSAAEKLNAIAHFAKNRQTTMMKALMDFKKI
jgi:hypothetical protein